MFKSHKIQFLFQSKFSACTSSQQKAQTPARWHQWPLWTLHPLSPYLHPPTPTFRANRLTAIHPSIHPSGQLFSLWEHDFITEMNCLIVKTQLPPFTGEGGASLDIGASCSDPASGVSSPTVWKASHVTHHWMTAPSSQPRALSQPHRALMCWTSLSIFTVLNECIFMDTKYMKNMAFNTKVTSLFILEKNLKYLKCLTILEISF